MIDTKQTMINRINFISLAVGFVIILTLNTSYGSAEKEIPETRLGSQGGGGHTMTFLYWYVKTCLNIYILNFYHW